MHCPSSGVSTVILLLIGAGGFAGAAARFWISRAAARWLGSNLPWGTFLANVSGSLLLGWLAGLALKGTAIPPEWLMAGSAGFLGAFTTFSTLGLETLHLADRFGSHLGLLNLLLSALVGLAAALVGIHLGMAA